MDTLNGLFMANKQVSMRWSWALDELAGEMAAHFGYADKTALVKGLLRYAARVDKTIGHTFSLPLSHQTPATQDRIDETLLKKWRAGETIHRQQLDLLAKEAAEANGAEAEKIKAKLAQDFLKEVKTQK